MEDVVKSMTAELDKDLKGISAVKPTPLVHTTTARDRVTNAITELNALVGDLNTLIKTLSTIKERL